MAVHPGVDRAAEASVPQAFEFQVFSV